MNTKYWKEFYKNKKRDKESSFARFCAKRLDNLCYIEDLGCGDGRDSYYFSDKGHFVFGVDAAVENKLTENAYFYKEDIEDYIKGKSVGVTYCRFLFHAISEKQMWKILNWADGLIMAEFRVKGDEPVIYTDHKRREIDPYKLLEQLFEKGYIVEYFKVGRGMAKYKGEDPLVCRIICRK